MKSQPGSLVSLTETLRREEMRCFFHPETPAVGTCKSCGRGLCRECAVEYPQGLACRGRCEADVEALIALITDNVKASGVGAKVVLGYRRALFASAAFISLMGVVFLAAAFEGKGVEWLPLGFGGACVAFGLFHFGRAIKLRDGGRQP